MPAPFPLVPARGTLHVIETRSKEKSPTRPLCGLMQASGLALEQGDPIVIVFNNTAVASELPAGPGVVRQTLLTDENVEEAGIRFDRLALAADASFRFEPSAGSMLWFQVLEGDAKLKTFYTDDLSDRHSAFLPPAFDATLLTERRQGLWRRLIRQENARGVSLLCAELPDARRFDPEFATRQPLFTVSDWTREPVRQCKNDRRKRFPS
jgi:hypothetical protein